MTLAEIIADVDALRPNQFTAQQKTAWVNEVESNAVEQVINRAIGNDVEFEPYVYEVNAATELLIPDIHKPVYEAYLFAQMDYVNGEIDRYNIDVSMYSAAWDAYASRYRREHYPKPVETFKGIQTPYTKAGLSIAFVAVLPTTGTENTLYFVRNSAGTYTQYVWQNDAWVQVGVTNSDLSEYWSKTELTAIDDI